MQNLFFLKTNLEDMLGSLLCPGEAEQGDEIIILFGLYIPLVFRKDVNGFYRVIGEAYVQRLMDGEALELDLQVSDIRLK
ncbi:uncharacterized protein K444DRAFT_621431 [Hyaloscypha bicolor E]|uniref:Uncharacterized protein n=1 Tax=Hyaloscypha bicolor E TaxID=1095630 RepID=A0A2J6SNE9_9HELO|nr:uncharacterized protein K444DRAFT_621431 [Hyaloscypha bicolor E]PMD52296.1 hypothetical protein K444DRAFT_621431 [Hyaloscypha bicolor E]